MTLEEYKLLAAELRGHMEQPMPPMDLGSVTATKEPAYLPGGEKRSMKADRPVSEDDLSHLNNKNWRKYQERGRRNGRKSARMKR